MYNSQDLEKNDKKGIIKLNNNILNLIQKSKTKIWLRLINQLIYESNNVFKNGQFVNKVFYICIKITK